MLPELKEDLEYGKIYDDVPEELTLVKWIKFSELDLDIADEFIQTRKHYCHWITQAFCIPSELLD